MHSTMTCTISFRRLSNGEWFSKVYPHALEVTLQSDGDTFSLEPRNVICCLKFLLHFHALSSSSLTLLHCLMLSDCLSSSLQVLSWPDFASKWELCHPSGVFPGLIKVNKVLHGHAGWTLWRWLLPPPYTRFRSGSQASFWGDFGLRVCSRGWISLFFPSFFISTVLLSSHLLTQHADTSPFTLTPWHMTSSSKRYSAGEAVSLSVHFFGGGGGTWKEVGVCSSEFSKQNTGLLKSFVVVFTSCLWRSSMCLGNRGTFSHSCCQAGCHHADQWITSHTKVIESSSPLVEPSWV